MYIGQKYLWFPIHLGSEEKYLELWCENQKIHEFKIPCKTEEAECEVSYYASIPVSEYIGKDIEFKGDFSDSFFRLIKNEDHASVSDETRPAIHFTASHGWINDPNGLVFDGENYHLYFQYNPFNVEWQNMLWGHATSKDLVHWTQQDSVLFPDENGMMFSGSAIKKDDKLFYFYTAAAITPWSEGKLPTQRMAVSRNKGMSLVKEKRACVEAITKETRDPKVFWHEKSQAYIMVLYIDANDFGIFRSTDLYDWKMSQKITLADAWECPDLLCFLVEGQELWMFTSADGFYYFGSFDGYEFKTDGVKHVGYGNNVLYAAQSYSGITDRIVSVPWLRLSQNGANLRGAMGIPRELSIRVQENDYILRFAPIREIVEGFRPCTSIPKAGPVMLSLEDIDKEDWSIEIGQSVLQYDKSLRQIKIDDECYKLMPKSHGISIIIDYNILEISQADDILPAAYLLKGNTNDINGQLLSDSRVSIYGWEELWQH